MTSKGGIVAFLARFREVGILFFLAVVVVLTTLKAPRFLQWDNLSSILLDVPLLITIAMGMTMVIISRNIDLSVGSMMGLSAMVVGMTLRANPNLPILVAMLIGIGAGAALGAVNGTLIAFLRVPAIIATLGTLSIYRGIIFILSDGKSINSQDLPDALTFLAKPAITKIPIIVVIALLVVLLAHLFLRTQRTGRDIFAIGSNPNAARLRGVPVTKTLFLVFLITGAVSGLAGFMYTARFAFVDPAQAGTGFELSVIAATVIGGTAIFGGAGSAFGTLLGCLLLGVINNALAITDLNQMWQLAVYGAIILIAVYTDSLIRSRLGKPVKESA